jgi:exopolysaccharide biosynthesis polyprenyl glycosylphosphotransferase
MARRSPGGQARFEQAVPPAAPIPLPFSARAGRPLFLSTDWLPKALIVGDAVIAGASVLVAYWFHHRFDPIHTLTPGELPLGPYLVAIPFVILIYVAALTANHQYQSWRGRTLVDLLLQLFSGIGLAAILMLAVITLGNLGGQFSRLTITYTIVLTFVLMTIERYFLRQYETRLRRRGIGTERVLMVGTGAGSEMLIQRMNMFPQYGFQVVGVADDGRAAGSRFAGAPVVGRIDDLHNLARDLHVDQVFLAVEGGSRADLLRLIKLCEDQMLEFKIVPDLLDVMSTRVDVDAIDGVPLVGIRHNQLRGANAAIKRAIDVAVSASLLLLLSPILLIVGALIKVNSPGGPILFKQERIGMHRRPFTVFKFRTMIPDAEASTGPMVARPGDPRATAPGRVLRRTSLDELPQLFNILRGDMSLVGPRPQPTFFDEKYSADVPRYLERQQVRPGLTGWAEVNDLRGAAPIVDRTLYDVYYIENWSLVLDIKILLLTGIRIFFQRHAY